MKSITRRKALENKEVFRRIKIKNTKVSIEKVRILNTVDAEMKVYEELIKPTEEQKKYDSENMELIKQYADKDEKGDLITKDGINFPISKDIEGFRTSLAALDEKYKKNLEERAKADSELKDWLDEELTTSNIIIKVEQLPDSLTDDEIKAIEVYAEIV